MKETNQALSHMLKKSLTNPMFNMLVASDIKHDTISDIESENSKV